MPSHRYRWARWGWLGTTLALGAALVITAWIGRDRSVGVAATLNRGQGELWMESVRHVVRDFDTTRTAHALDSVLSLRREAGLRGISLFDPSGVLLARAGDSIPGVRLPPPGPRPLTIEQIGPRVRLTGVAFAGRPAGSAEGRPRLLVVVLEFVPVAAQQLVAEATGTFVLSSIVAAALLAATALFWHLLTLREAAERRLEHQQRLGMLGEMSAVLAHEIRNPLASLKGHAQLLSERLGEASAAGAKAQLVVTEAERLEVLTDDLQEFARSGPIEMQPTDPAALLVACADEVAHDGFVVWTDRAPPDWPLDTSRMRQVLTNVLRNARQATPDGARPEARVEVVRHDLVFTIRDFGPGIPAGDERRIFEPFYTTRTSGTGLGLAVASRVVRMHNGTISAGSHPDGGAIFTIAIPNGRS
jgi:two-component system sensor histidine kinase HydH